MNSIYQTKDGILGYSTINYKNRSYNKYIVYTTDSLSGEAVNDDLLFSYDYDNDVWLDAVDVMGEGDDAVPIIYDANGNQVEISNVRYHWTNGRQLSAMTYIDDDGAEQPLASYTYDDNGIRTSKTFGGTTTYYTNVDGAITSQYCLDEDGAVTDLMQFLYDGSNELLGFTYNNNTYFYVKNLQGDVIAVIDSTGTEKAVYEYGAYGTLIYSGGDLADVNPMRYRGYYYDSDAGMYYLQSRYYAPEFAKFLNSDLPEYAQVQKADHYGTNLFAYCCNDPVNNSDPTGCTYKSGFKSIKNAVRKWANDNFKKSKSMQREFCALLFSYYENKKLRYGYTGTAFGTKDSCDPVNQCKYYAKPDGAKVIATIHTHPNATLGGLSEKDYRYDKYHCLNGYVVCNKGVYYHNYTWKKGDCERILKYRLGIFV